MKKLLIAGSTAVLATVLLSGCGSAAAKQDTTAPPATQGSLSLAPVLPMSDMFAVLPAPLMDGAAHFTGETASVANPDYDYVELFDAPAGKSIGGLDRDQFVPVVGRAVAAAPAGVEALHGQVSGEWIRVMLPSRVSLPSTADDQLRPHINEGTAWVWGGDVKVNASKTHIYVDKAGGTVTVGNLGGDRIASFTASIGASVPLGPTFIATGSMPTSTCSGGPVKFLSAQGINADGLQGQSVNPTAFMGPGEDCFTGPGDLTSVLPNMIRLSPADEAVLAKYAAPGTPIDVIDSLAPVEIASHALSALGDLFTK
ncbi:hypothetical protein [Arthrobacter sp. 162MFSha1.1]|uniref:hypothetical protein n=1 Tax=Arthrobacter sp. 162MFSha1.1 TaxID=1151119 RepID=UPI0003815AF6|nr:hypothetical protein [Arthrobacter sp. 162MFSha1.1]